MIEKLIEFDKKLFLFLNGHHHAFFDFLFWWSSQALIWLPVYIIFLYLVIREYRWQALIIIVFAALCVAATDQVSVNLFKNVFLRFRPSHNMDIKDQIHIINDYRGGLYGFVSSHAANFFGIATLLSVIFYRRVRAFIPLVFFWAALISYSRIYLGVHYPADVVIGALVGIIIGLITGILFKILSTRLLIKSKFFSIEKAKEVAPMQ